MRKPTDQRPGAIAREIVEEYLVRLGIPGLPAAWGQREEWLARRIADEIRKARRGG